MKKPNPLRTPLTGHPMNPNPMNPNQPCRFGGILEYFHADYDRSSQTLTGRDVERCVDVFREIAATYVPNLTKKQWLKVLGELVADFYRDPNVLTMSQSISRFTITAHGLD